MRRRRLPSLPSPTPRGYVWLAQRLVPIAMAEEWEQQTMAAFDGSPGAFGNEHWRNDPSYDWAAQTKRKKESQS
jgi:hypothetical protein